MYDTEWFCGAATDDVIHQRVFTWRVVAEAILLGIALALLPALTAGCATVEVEQGGGRSPYNGPPMVISDEKGNTIRLTKEPCPNVSGWLAMASASMVYEGKNYKACWVKVGSYIVIFDSNGDVTPIPASAFRQEIAA